MSAVIDRDTFFRLYAAEESYYSAKVRPALRYKRVPFVELLPTVRVQREVRRLDAGARARVDRAFAGTGCEALLAHDPGRRVERRPYRLVLAG